MIDPSMMTLNSDVQSYIASYLEKQGYKDMNIKVEPGSNIGDNFMGFIGKLTVTAVDEKGETKTFNWIGKTAPNTMMHRDGLSLTAQFKRESYVYSDVLPTFHAFEKEKRVLEPFKEHAGYVLSYLEEPNESIILENIKTLGFVMKVRKDPLDLNHVKLVMKAYAKLHAVSYALKDQKPDEFKKLTDNMEDVVRIAITTQSVQLIQGMSLQFSLGVLDPVKDANVLIAHKKFTDNYLDIVVKLLSETNDRSVIGHGDCWVNNMLWKYGLPDSTIPTEVCLLDWQMSRYGSPAFDLSYFIFTGTTKEFRDEHYHNMIRLYYYTLCAQISDLGSDPEKLITFDGLQEELQKNSLWGLYMSIGLLGVITRDFSNVPLLPDVPADMSNVDIEKAIEMQKQFMLAGVDVEAYSKRVRDVIIDGYELGYFKHIIWIKIVSKTRVRKSWCEWQKQTALLHPDVQKEILPIYEDLSRDELLERCLGVHTQNANESFNSTVWRLAPKHLHSGLKIVELASYLAVGLYNEGNSSLLMAMNEAGIVVGKQSFNYAGQMDNQRVNRQNRRSSLESKEGRKARKALLQAQNEAYEEEEGLLYGAGIAD